MNPSLEERFQELLKKITEETATKEEELEFLKTFNTELEKVEKLIISNRTPVQE